MTTTAAPAPSLSAASPSVAARGAIKIDNVVKAYGEGPARVLAVDGCSLEIAAGEICAVVGPSGCGKTSLLNAIAGFHSIDGGAIYLDGQLLCGPQRPQAEIGPDRVVVFQNGALFPWKTVLENVAFGPTVQRAGRRAGTRAETRAETMERAREMLAGAGLGGYENVFPGRTSSSVCRRVEIVRALMTDPAVLLLDEPYRALDSLTKSVMHESLLKLYARNRVTIFFITHDLEEAIFLGSRVVIMTSRPCRPKAIINVDIPYPRAFSVVTDRRYRQLVQETTEAVQAEARKAFDLGETEGRA
jgi:NitT/TauT family transport system ATP-binding protein